MNVLSFLRSRVLPAALLVAAVLLATSIPVACRAGSAGISLLQGDFSPPRITGLQVTGSRTVRLSFDRRAADAACSVRQDGEAAGEACPVEWDEAHAAATFSLPCDMEPGCAYVLGGVVSDVQGNTLTLSIPFSGYNARPARLVLAEVRNAYSSRKQQYEFVKLCCLSAGNTAGFELVAAGDGEQCAYRLPPLEVRAGEFVTVHLRKMKGKDGGYAQQGMLDEVNGRIDESFAADSSATAWDLWVENEKSRLAPSDILVLRNRNDGSVADALLYTMPDKAPEAWESSYAALEQEVARSGVWTDADGQASASRQSACLAEGITSSAVTRSLLRRNCTELLRAFRTGAVPEAGTGEGTAPAVCSSAADWTVAVKSTRSTKKRQ